MSSNGYVVFECISVRAAFGGGARRVLIVVWRIISVCGISAISYEFLRYSPVIFLAHITRGLITGANVIAGIMYVCVNMCIVTRGLRGSCKVLAHSLVW